MANLGCFPLFLTSQKKRKQLSLKDKAEADTSKPSALALRPVSAKSSHSRTQQHEPQQGVPTAVSGACPEPLLFHQLGMEAPSDQSATLSQISDPTHTPTGSSPLPYIASHHEAPHRSASVPGCSAHNAHREIAAPRPSEHSVTSVSCSAVQVGTQSSHILPDSAWPGLHSEPIPHSQQSSSQARPAATTPSQLEPSQDLMSARSSGSRDSKPQPRGLALVISEPETADTWQDQVLLGMLVDSSLVLGPASEEEPSACDTLSYCPTESPRSPSMTHSGDHHMVTLTDSGENADSQADSGCPTPPPVAGSFSLVKATSMSTTTTTTTVTTSTMTASLASLGNTSAGASTLHRLRVVSIAGQQVLLSDPGGTQSATEHIIQGSIEHTLSWVLGDGSGGRSRTASAMERAALHGAWAFAGSSGGSAASSGSMLPPPVCYRSSRKDRSLLMRPLRVASHPDLGSIAEDDAEHEQSDEDDAPQQQQHKHSGRPPSGRMGGGHTAAGAGHSQLHRSSTVPYQ